MRSRFTVCCRLVSKPHCIREKEILLDIYFCFGFGHFYDVLPNNVSSLTEFEWGCFGRCRLAGAGQRTGGQFAVAETAHCLRPGRRRRPRRPPTASDLLRRRLVVQPVHRQGGRSLPSFTEFYRVLPSFTELLMFFLYSSPRFYRFISFNDLLPTGSVVTYLVYVRWMKRIETKES